MNADESLDEAVVDSNVLVSGVIIRRGIPAQIVDALLLNRFRLLMSDDQRDELFDVFSRPKFVAGYESLVQDHIDFLRFIDLNARFVPVSTTPAFGVRDPDDEAILATALVGRAVFLVTGDHDLLLLAGDPRLGSLRIVTPRQFLTALDPAFER